MDEGKAVLIYAMFSLSVACFPLGIYMAMKHNNPLWLILTGVSLWILQREGNSK